MPGGSTVSFNGMNSCLSSLKTCQSYINSGMDITTKVALDLVENHNDMEEVDEMEKVMLEYVAMSRDVSHYVQAVEETVNQIKREKPENVPDLKDLVREKFTALERTNDDLELQRNEKFTLFKEQLTQMKTQFGVQLDAGESEALEQVDEDLVVTQSQMNFICPITQVEMKKPVRNKTCGHSYEESAILGMIAYKENQKKKALKQSKPALDASVQEEDTVCLISLLEELQVCTCFFPPSFPAAPKLAVTMSKSRDQTWCRMKSLREQLNIRVNTASLHGRGLLALRRLLRQRRWHVRRGGQQ